MLHSAAHVPDPDHGSGSVGGARATVLALAIGLAVFGAWLTVMPAAVLTLALRLEGETSASTYSIVVAVGWCASIAGLAVFGRFSDRLLAQRGSRTSVIALAIPLVLLAGLVLAVAQAPLVVGLGWILTQLAAALLVTSAQALVGDALPSTRQGLASGLIGAAPVLALLVGSLLVLAVGESPVWTTGAPAILAALLAIPLVLLSRGLRGPHVEATERVWPSSSARGRTGPWVLVLVVSLLLGCATATVDTYLVPWSSTVIEIPRTSLADVTSLALLAATVAGIAGGLIGGLTATHGDRAARAFGWGCLAMGAGLAGFMLWANSATLALFGAIIGVAFGMANGARLKLALTMRGRTSNVASDLGDVTAIATIPYVLVPAIGAAALSLGESVGLHVLFAAATASALACGLLMLVRGARMVNVARGHLAAAPSDAPRSPAV